jgi:hypothetical protein
VSRLSYFLMVPSQTETVFSNSLIKQRDLPAVLLSVRTLLPMAETRLRLFQSIVSAFPLLTRGHLLRDSRLQAVLEGKRKAKAALSTLVDPFAMDKLSLSNERGARLDVIFAIGFNRWGHAEPNIAVMPILPPSCECLLSSCRAKRIVLNTFVAVS